MRQRDRHRHQLRRLVAGVTDHHALVAGAGQVKRILATIAILDRTADALADFRALLADRNLDVAARTVDAEGRIDVTNLLQSVPGDALKIDGRSGGDLADHHDQVLGRGRFARHAAHRVLREIASRTESEI